MENIIINKIAKNPMFNKIKARTSFEYITNRYFLLFMLLNIDYEFIKSLLLIELRIDISLFNFKKYFIREIGLTDFRVLESIKQTFLNTRISSTGELMKY